MASRNKTLEITIIDDGGTFNTFFKRFTGNENEYDFEGLEKLRKMLNNEKARIINTIKTKKLRFRGNVTNKRKNGELYIASADVSPILNGKGEVEFFVGIERDITKELDAKRQLEHKVEELERMNEIMVGRELKMTELKKEVEMLKEMLEKKKIG